MSTEAAELVDGFDAFYQVGRRAGELRARIEHQRCEALREVLLLSLIVNVVLAALLGAVAAGWRPW